ncbi:putative fungistatic metabolite [Podospora conica]|nr:putative fungistatic metabolite [Schizothecium conicum]
MDLNQERTTYHTGLTDTQVSRSVSQSIPSTLPDGWASQGCWIDVGRTIGAAGYASATAMTIQSCVSFCETRGFAYAGVEYSTECFCGNTMASSATQVSDTACSMACSGDPSQPCGGPSRLNIFHTTVVSGPRINPGVNGFVHMGCYSEGTSGRTLTHGVSGAIVPGVQMSVDRCTAACANTGFPLAGVEYGSECFCDHVISNGGAPATGCNMVCNGNSSEFCGAGGRLNVYTREALTLTTGITATANSSTTTQTGPLPTGPSQPETVGNYVWAGCRTEAVGKRALSGAGFTSDTMTLEACREFCSAFAYFGVEYARECYCGNELNTGSVLTLAAECSYVCSGNPFQYCGQGNRLSVYQKDGALLSSSTSGPPASTTSTPVVITGLPSGWTPQGCWIESAPERALPYQVPDSQLNSPTVCANTCKNAGYKISGTEYGAQCFCGNTMHNGATPTAQTDCSMDCPGDSTQKCGAGNRLSIVSEGAPRVDTPPVPQTGGLGGSWTYQGCAIDNVNGKRTFYWPLMLPGILTPSMCLERCAEFGYHAAGLEYGSECYCGDPANMVTRGSTFRPESECNTACGGNSSAICGGGSRLSTYFWTGEPLYQWDFPTDYRAGQYQFLINGVTIPLMTMETVTGKVSFISKFGTGPGNETGAYELDLTKVGNPGTAWRQLHLKTDVFCSAGITLPDKVGRQLTVGGWSGESTYGTRLYWPGKDWQEDVHVLKLQAGRWYPSVMIMTNGSIMVIGGQTGSNAAAVPSIEILPYTGTAPLYMDWLDRTDPNNLYPFVCVLPSGGIFVAYWNEARILDAATFTTIKTLPNAPGAPNDPLAGRTYPLEGASVLLPQRHPYTDPLGILMCGGSTMGIGAALDNCVSISPDDPNPEWQLERMPSPRVMSLMAPLPDGTFFVGGGAHQGVAGFGLATSPNLNALLYDPARPLGRRFTVAANTTIARMYHSEAVTLLDGRVLVSGSNPEDGVNPEEYRVEVFLPPYLLSGLPRPSFVLAEGDRDWEWDQRGIPFVLAGPAVNGNVTATLLGAVSSTHGNSMGARTLMPRVVCAGTACTVDAPPNGRVCPPGWYQFFVLDGGVPAVGVYVRIGGDPAGLGSWPQAPGFTVPGA